MKTPEEWLETVDFDWDEQVSVRMIEAIQQDAFESGRVEVLRVLGECVSSIEELDWSYDHNSLDVLERREMALKHARQVLGITDRKEFLGTFCTRCGSYHPADQQCLMPT